MNKLYKVSSKEVKDRLLEFEFATYKQTGVKYHSGGFSKATIEDWDDEVFKITLRWGIQNDVQNIVNTEYYLMDRKTLKIKEWK